MPFLVIMMLLSLATFMVVCWIAYAIDQASRHPHVTFVKSLRHPFDKKKAHGIR